MIVEYSLNGSTWTDMSGVLASVTPGGGEREIGTIFTADGDTPIVKPGKRNEFELTVRIVYTEGVSEPAKVLRDAWRNATPIYFRYAPKGDTVGNYQFTTTQGYVRSPSLPEGEVQDGTPVAVEFTLVVPDFTEAAIT